MFLVYAVIPFILLLLFHYLYIRLGLYITRPLSYKSAKAAFWLLYGGFGIILVYTDYIWKAYPSTPEPENQYKHYARTDTGTYQKVHLYGNVSPQLKVVFSAYLRTGEPQCIKHPKARYASVRVEYPAITSDKYDMDIFKEYTDEKTGCHYQLGTLFIQLYRKDLTVQEPEYNDKIIDRYFDHEWLHFSNPDQVREATIVCSEEKTRAGQEYPLNTFSTCELYPNRESAKPDTQKIQSMKLDINTTGAISGLSGSNVTKRWAISDVMQKFQIADYPAH